VTDKVFWVLLRRFWSGWKQALVIVNPETVVRWHRAGFALYWRTISRIRYADATGRIRRQKVGTQEEAGARLKLRKEEAKLGALPRLAWRRRPVLFHKIAEDALAYADQYKRSAKNDHYRMKRLLEWFGDEPADSITPQEIEARFRSELWRPATWNRVRALLSMVYRVAIRSGKVSQNSVRLVSIKAAHNERVRFLSVEEEKKLRAVILERFPERLPEFDLALHSGMRLSEQYGARWANVDFERRILTVLLDKGGKTSYVPLNAAALRALAELHRQHGGTEFVCGGSRNPRWWFEQALRAARITDFSWHCLRHTFGRLSRLVMSGADLRTVAELLRGRTLAMVMRYAHLPPDYKLEAVQRMEEKFSTETDTKLTPRENLVSGRVQ